MAEKKMIIKFVVDNFEEATKDIEDVFNVLLNFNEDGFWESGCTPAFFNKLLGTLCKPRPHLRKAIITSICKTSATTFPGGKIGLKRDGIILRFWDHILAGEFDSLSDKVLVEQCKDHCLMHFGLKPKDGIEIEAEAYEDSDFESVSPKKLAVKSASKLDSSSSVSSAVECDQCDGTPIKSKVPSGDISGDDDVSQYIDDDFERSSPVSDKNASSGRSKVDARSSLLSDDSIGQYLDDDFEMDSSTKPTNSKVNPLDSTHSGSSNYGNDEFEVDTANPSQLDVSVYSVDGPPISNRLSKPKSAQVPFIEEMQEMNGMTANELAEYIVDSSGNYQSNPSLSISKSKGVRSGSVEPSEEDEDSEMETTMKSFMNKHNINAFTPSNVVTPIVPSGGRTPKEESVVTPSEECESDDKQSEVKDVDAKDTSVIFHDSEPEAYANEIDELNGFEQGGIRPCSGKDVVEVSATAHPSTVNAYPVASSSHTDKPVVAPENNRKIIESPVRLYDRPKGNSSTKRYTSNKAISKSAASSNVRVSAGGAGKSTSDKGEIVTHPTGNEYKSPSPAMWAQLQRERTQARQQFISVDSVSRNKEKSVFSDYNEMNNVLLSHVLYYSNLLKTIIKEAYDMWQKRLRESLKRGLEDLNSKYMEQVLYICLSLLISGYMSTLMFVDIDFVLDGNIISMS